MFKGENSKTDRNLRRDVDGLKQELVKIEFQGKNIQNQLLQEIRSINDEVKTERNLAKSLFKRELIAGILGGFIVGFLFIMFYCYNGMLRKVR